MKDASDHRKVKCDDVVQDRRGVGLEEPQEADKIIYYFRDQ